MKMYSFRYIFPQAFKSMKNNGWLTAAAILTITISLFLCAFFWMIIININVNATEIEDDVRVMAYIDFDVPESDYEEIELTLRNIDGVQSVEFVSKDDGLLTLEDRFNDTDLLSTLEGDNPLPDMFSITAEDSQAVAAIAEEVSALDGIYHVRYGEGTVEKLFTMTDTVRKASIVVMALLGVAAVTLIAMAIRLTILGRKKEIMVMKWCGATDAFVRWPFFLEGMILGIFGSILALALALILYGQVFSYLTATISFATIVPLSQLWPGLTLFLIGAGVVLGAIGSLIPLARFLKV